MHFLLIVVPFFSLIFLNLPLGSWLKKAAFWLGLVLLSCQALLVLKPAYPIWTHSPDMFSAFFKINLAVDNLSRLFLLSIAIVLFCVLWVQKYTSKDQERNFNFLNICLLLLCGLNGMVMVRDIFSLYVFLEISAVSSFILIVLNKEPDAFEAAFKYIILSAVATVLMLSAIALLLAASGDTSFTALSAALKTQAQGFLITFAIGIFLCGCFIKSGLMPFHGWLPDAYSAAPASVSVLLAGVVTKTAGVYTLIRIVGAVFGFDHPIKQILLVVGIFSVVCAALAALGQSDFKRMLAYSSISQLGYIILGLGSGTALGLAGAALHIFNHSVFKSLLFVNCAAVENQTGTRNMDQLSGLAQKMPITGLTSVLASLSCAGIPPLAGFWSKLVIIIALWLSGRYVYAIIAVLASILTLAYFLSLQRRVFFGQLAPDLANIKEAGLALLVPTVLLALLTLGIGLFFPLVINTFLLPIKNIFGG